MHAKLLITLFATMCLTTSYTQANNNAKAQYQKHDRHYYQQEMREIEKHYMHDKQQIDTFTPASYFKHLDSNRDNFLSIAELMSGGLSEMKLEEQNEIIEYIQQEVDLDKDGYISMEEFLKSEENGDGLIDWNEEDRQWANEHLQPEYAQQAAAAAANTQQQQYMKNQRFDSEYYDHHVQQQNSNNNKKPFVGGVPDKFKAL